MNETFKQYELLEFFKLINYDWENDLEKLEEICKYTKTRPEIKAEKFSMGYGSEQPFLIKAIIKKIGAESFFEIGTGRGTASYSVALEPKIKSIVTIDKIPHFFSQQTAINYEPIKISQRGINKLIRFPEKKKIKFFHIFQKFYIKLNYKNKFDAAFIDGNHTDVNIIKNDIELCLRVLKKDGVLIFDDYESKDVQDKKFSVGSVVDEFLKENKDYYSYLVEFRGHIFHKEKKELRTGTMILSPFKLTS